MCRVLVLALVIVAVVGAVEATALSRRLASKRAVGGTCAAGERLGCTDCSTVKVCSYDQTILTEYRCQDATPDSPYCVGAGICSPTPDPQSVCLSSDDLCPLGAPGYYPDPTNCTRYLYCDENKISYPETCKATNNVYNQTSGSCFLKTKSADCFQTDCTKNKDKWFVYTPFPQLYFLCSSKGPLVFLCPREHEVFNVNLKICEFQCPSDGRFAFPGNTAKYYECLYSSKTKLELYEKNCPPALTFDATVGSCKK
ncbi:uncharacterized protein LOC128278663 [Anopheles cruzii]|uniref:uncharacterized protein LOC128278663 n=1 Tax=Anopheles cruzii TaxID=68878 RepID=UPI0022EC83E9|nr:uncharacterized protein LOC128278663 [Anopheles cruzii]